MVGPSAGLGEVGGLVSGPALRPPRQGLSKKPKRTSELRPRGIMSPWSFRSMLDASTWPMRPAIEKEYQALLAHCTNYALRDVLVTMRPT